MKKINMYFLMLNLLISVNLFSQPYKSIFGSQTTQWNECIYEIDYTGTLFLNTIKDTMINANSYKKIVIQVTLLRVFFRHQIIQYF